MKITIRGRFMLRKANLKDLPSLAAIHIRSWQETYRGLLPDDLLDSLNQAEKEESWRPALTNPSLGTTVFVVDDPDDKIVGLAASGKQRDDTLANYPGEFLAIYVLNSHQKKGHGLRLMKAMCENLAARGIKSAALWVLEDNIHGRPFYESLGGKVVGQKTLTIKNMTKTELAYAWNISGLLDTLDSRLKEAV